MVEKMMITTATAQTSTVSGTVDVALNLDVAEDERKRRRSIAAERNEPEQNTERQQKQQQLLFINENDDKNNLQLINGPRIPDWAKAVQLSKTVIGNNSCENAQSENLKQAIKVRASPETPAFDFTKIETLFSNSTTSSDRSSNKSGGSDRMDDSVEVEVNTNSIGNNNSNSNNNTNNDNNNSNNNNDDNNDNKNSNNKRDSLHHHRNGTTVSGRKTTKALNRYGKEKRRKIEEKNSRSREPSTSPSSFERALTPSLDPKLLKQFEEEDRPKRVLRSSTASARLSKIGFISSAISDDSSSSKITTPHINVRMAAKKSDDRKLIQNGAKRKKSEKVSSNFTSDRTFPVESVFYAAQLNDKVKRKRLQAKDINKEIEVHSRRVKIEIDELLNNDLMMTIDSLKNTSLRTRHWSGVSSGRASTSSGSSSFTAMVRRRGMSQTRRSNLNSNWKLIGSPYESYVYIDYFFHEKQSTKQICYPQAVHSKTGDLLRLRDSVRVNSVDGEPNFAYICRLFNDPKTGIPLASVLWYYTAVQVKTDELVIPPVFDRELLASKHMDIIPLDTIDEIVWVLTYNEYGRFMAETTNDRYPLAQRVSEEDLLWKKGEDNYPRRTYLPRDDTPLELVYFCRRIYDCKQQKVETKIWRRKVMRSHR